MPEAPKKSTYDPSPFADREKLQAIPFADFGASGGATGEEQKIETLTEPTPTRIYGSGYAPTITQRGSFVELGDTPGEGPRHHRGDIRITGPAKGGVSPQRS